MPFLFCFCARGTWDAVGGSYCHVYSTAAAGYVSANDDNIELTVAAEDMAGLFERNSIADILRGAVLSPALAIDTYYAAALTNLSPLFKLPVDAVQRGRDHGLPTYNAVRAAYDLEEASTFEDLTGDTEVCAILMAFLLFSNIRSKGYLYKYAPGML